MKYPKGVIKERVEENGYEKEITFFKDQLIDVLEANKTLEFRTGGNFQHVSYHLPSFFFVGPTGERVSWHIVTDDWGNHVLVPKKEAQNEF